MRICCFLPSATEIVYALGLGSSLYGVSHECDYPSDARTKPKVVRSRFDPADLTSQQIDRLIAGMASKGERIYEVDVQTLRQARPDLVITQQLCDVCAVSFEDVQQAIVELEMPPQLISLDPSSLGDVLRDIESVGEATGKGVRARKLTADMGRRIETIGSRAAGASRPRVACIEWLDPLIAAGHWIPEMVSLAGGIDGLGQAGAPSRRITFEELADYSPEVVILMPCGMGVEKALQEFSRLDDLPRWQALPAFREGQAYAADAGGLYSRSGPRLVDGLELMAQMIHPELFPGLIPREAALRLEQLGPAVTGS